MIVYTRPGMSRKLAVHAEKEHYIDVLGRNALTRSEVAAFHDDMPMFGTRSSNS